uniref:Putative salivary lipocalin n=1 Tax=Ixodes ricinus TaxID=34613 RepID=A0A0K8R8C6_IXORI
MFVLVCAAAAILACRGASSQLTEGENQVQRHNDSRKLLSSEKTFYLLYRSEKSDSQFGGNAPCAQMKHIESFEKRSDGSVLKRMFYIHETKHHILRFYVAITPNTSSKALGYNDTMTARTIAFGTKDIYYDLLFTDYSSCFTLRRPEDDVYQLWSIGRPDLTNINEGCRSAYKTDSNDPGCSVERQEYYVFNETVCCHTRPIQ